nr:unnamed protein product [Digitaria exilis]
MAAASSSLGRGEARRGEGSSASSSRRCPCSLSTSLSGELLQRRQAGKQISRCTAQLLCGEGSGLLAVAGSRR